MINLAKESDEKSVSLPSIAKDEKISLGYLERLFSSLKKAELIKSEKGVAGGYRLSKPADKITIYNIVKALEGSMVPFYCVTERGRVKRGINHTCGASTVLAEVQKSVNKTLKDMKLKDLL